MGEDGDNVEDRGRAVNALVLLDHYLGGFDDGGNGVALFQLQFVSAAPRNRALDEIVANTNDNMGHDITQFDFFDFTAQFISG